MQLKHINKHLIWSLCVLDKITPLTSVSFIQFPCKTESIFEIYKEKITRRWNAQEQKLRKNWMNFPWLFQVRLWCSTNLVHRPDGTMLYNLLCRQLYFSSIINPGHKQTQQRHQPRKTNHGALYRPTVTF